MNSVKLSKEIKANRKLGLKPLALAVACCFTLNVAQANPIGAQVVNGTASIAQSGKLLTVTNSPNAIINWQGFSIGSGETTRFIQQSASSAVLNRVIGPDPSQLLGTLTSNGKVFLINPAGIMVGQGARIDVAGFVASTLNLSNADFLAGKLNFTSSNSPLPRAGEGLGERVVNNGSITTPEGGTVYLVAPQIENNGIITTPKGETILAAGNTVQLLDTATPGVTVQVTGTGNNATNLGQILADSGRIGMVGAVVRNSGTISASSMVSEGGRVFLRATSRVEAGGNITANGTSGGSVYISAAHSTDPYAPGVAVQTGMIVVLGTNSAGGSVHVAADNILSTSAIKVSGTTSGGQVSVLAANDMISASGATYTANGGTTFGGNILVAAGGNNYTSGSYLVQGATGGNITLTGKDVTLSAALLDASGQNGGGVIHVGGMRHGAPGFAAQGVVLTNAGNLTVTGATQIIANALHNGNGGEVVLWSDGTTRSGGSIASHGGAISGNGGFAEISGKQGLGHTGQLDLTAPHGAAGSLLLDPADIIIDSTAVPGALTGGGTTSAALADPHPVTGNQFGAYTTVLANGNVVVAVPADSLVAGSAGAVYLFSGTTGALISTLAGSVAADQVGVGGVTALTNGNFVVDSYVWHGGTGAVTWGSGTTGVNGTVGSANSLVGDSMYSSVGTVGNVSGWDARYNTNISTLGYSKGVVALANGNYVVVSPYWGGSNQGAVTWGDGTTGISGFVSSFNSLVGSTTLGDYVGFSVTSLSNGNYVVGSPDWNGYRGAATWGNGSTGTIGVVSSSNSLVGSAAYDTVGVNITALSNGNYVVNSYGWNSKAGAVTWGNGAGGTVGAVSAANSLVGAYINQNIGWGSSITSTDGVVALTNGNYVVNSSYAGFATWGDGSTAGVRLVGNASVSNSLQWPGGSYGTKVTALTNGNYVVANPYWNGVVPGGGAVTWGNGATGTTGTVSTSNSLYGNVANDNVGWGGITALTNGNYVVSSPHWDNASMVDAGAATWGNGAGGTVGAVSTANSLYGSTASDQVSWNGAKSTIVALSNGNYVVGSPKWDNASMVDAGAATWGDGAGVTAGAVSTANSLYGSTASDQVGYNITALANGNYVVSSSNWANGAVLGAGAATWGNGATAGTRLTGAISLANSIVGSTLNDYVGGTVITLPNGNYVVSSSSWDNGAVANAGAVTWGNGAGGTAGTIAAVGSAGIVASLIGDTSNDQIGGGYLAILSNGNYVVNTPWWHSNTGHVALGSSTAGLSGVASSANGVVGAAAGDYLGYDYAGGGSAGGTGNGVRALPNGGYAISSKAYNGGLFSGIGRVSIEGIPFTGAPFSYTPSSPLSVNPSDINTQLNAGTSVTLQANNDITQNAGANITATGLGNLTLQAGRSVMLNAMINIAGALNITANDAGAILANRAAGTAVLNSSLATLTAKLINLTNSGGDILAGAMTANTGAIHLTASNNISVAAAITATAAGMGVTLNSNSTGVVGSSGNIQITSSIVTNGGNITLGGGAPDVVTGLPTAAAVGSSPPGTWNAAAGGIYLTGAALNAGGGNIVMRGTGAAGISNGSDGIYITSSSVVQTAGAGTITLNGMGGAGGAGSSSNSGVRFGTGAQLSSVNGAISIIGQGGAGNNGSNYGIYVHNGATITSTGTGTITLNGTGAATGTGNAGVRVSASLGATRITAAGGALIINGTGGASDGLQIVSGALVQNSAGDILLRSQGGSGVLLTAAAINTTGNVTLDAIGGGAITQTNGSITAAGLSVLGDTTASAVTLNSAANHVSTLAGNLAGTASSLAYTDSGAFAIGGVTSFDGTATTTTSGLTSTGTVNLSAPAGAIAVNGILTSSLGNIVLSAASGISQSADITAYGDVTLTANMNSGTGNFIQNGGLIGNTGTVTPGSITINAYDIQVGATASKNNVMLNAAHDIRILNVGVIGGGTAQNFHVDDQSFAYTLPFGFTYYGVPYSTMYVSSNGIITFGGGTSQWTYGGGANQPTWNAALIAGVNSRPTIAPAWSDWVTYSNLGKDIYIHQPSANTLAVRWDVANFGDNSYTANFETVLSQQGNIAFNYGAATAMNPSYTATIGVSQGDGVHYTLSALNNPASLNNLSSTLFTYNAGTGNYVETLGVSVAGGGSIAAVTGVSLIAAGVMNINNPITAATINGQATGITLGTTGTLTASGTGNAIILNAGAGNFINNAGATALGNTGGGRWLVYSADPALDTFGGLASGSLALWGRSYATYATAGVVETGNRYLFSLAPALTVSAALTKTYGTDWTSAPPAATITGLVNAATYGNVFAQDAVTGTAATLTSTGFAAHAGVLASPYAVTVAAGTLAAPAGYGATTYTNGTLTVTPFLLTVTATGNNKVYDATTTATALLSDNRITGDLLTLGYGSASYIDKNVATGKTVNVSGITLAGPDAGNYTFNTTAATTANITPAALTLTAVTDTRMYNGTTSSTGVVGSTGLLGTDTVTATQSYASKNVLGANGSTLQVNAGYVVNDGNGGGNYTITLNNASGTITPAPLTITANNASKTYNGLAYSGGNGVTYSGFDNGETSTVLGGALAYGGTSQGAVNAGSYLITPNGLTSGNYTIGYLDGVLTVSQPAVVASTALQQTVAVLTTTTTTTSAPHAPPPPLPPPPPPPPSVSTFGPAGGSIGGTAGTFGGTDTLLEGLNNLPPAAAGSDQPGNAGDNAGGNGDAAKKRGTAKEDDGNVKNNKGKEKQNAKPEKC